MRTPQRRPALLALPLVLLAAGTRAADPALSRTGWTASADSYALQAGHEPGDVLDDTATTF
jgi:hypothetical protein